MDPARDPLSRLVEECLAALEQEGEGALDRICAQQPDSASALRRRVDRLRELGLVRLPECAVADAFPERFGDFHLEARLGMGGMGVVYRARQESLGREVALKIVRPEQLYFPQAKARFRREVETIARLQHPSIVPIHCVGEEGGVPWFAMELLRGASLARVIAALSGRSPAELTGGDFGRAVAELAQDPEFPPDSAASNWLFAGSWSDACLRVVRHVADALAHAHGRGVLHRDVKPSNVVVTPGGRVVLLDFGLASSRLGGELTRSGSVVGSLPYLSPEQAHGDAAAVDARSDVYSLGVTLYELLTLTPAFGQPETAQLLAAIDAGRRAPPRSLNPALPRDAETVCLVAIERAPARRYATAADFARDLDNVLTRRPIEARRPGAAVRLARWVQRQPGTAAAAALAALLVVGGPVAWAQKERRARLDLVAANERTDAQRRRAEAHFRRALATIDGLIEPLRRRVFDDFTEVASLKREVLERALSIYATFPEEESSDPEFRRDLGVAARQLGEIRESLGEDVPAGGQYDQAIAIFAPLAAARPDDDDLFQQLATVRVRRGTLHRTLGEYDPAVARFQEVIAAVGPRVEAGSAPRPCALLLSEAEVGAGMSRCAQEQQAEGVELGRRGIDRLRALRECTPTDRAVEAALAEACSVLGASIYAGQPGGEFAEGWLRDAIEAYETLAEHDSLRWLWQAKGARGRWILAQYYRFSGRCPEALGWATTSVERLEPLVARFPEVVFYRRNLAVANMTLAAVQLGLGAPDAARRAADRALAVQATIRDGDPARESPAYYSMTIQVARVRRLMGDAASALTLVLQAIAWAESPPTDPAATRVAPAEQREWYWERLRCQAELGSGDALVEGAARLLGPEASEHDLLFAASLLARGAVVLFDEPTPPSDEPAAMAARVAAALLELMRGARERGIALPTLADDHSIGQLARRAELKAPLAELGIVAPTGAD